LELVKAFQIMEDAYAQLGVEELKALLVDRDNKILSYKEKAKGQLGCIVVRRLFKLCLSASEFVDKMKGEHARELSEAEDHLHKEQTV
jgi:hypothetical protein